MLSSSYRLDQFPDPDAYVVSVAAVLEGYPDDVIHHVTDVRTGMQRGCKFPPTIAEVVTACEVLMQDVARRKRLTNWGKNNPPLLDAPREQRPTYDELKAKYGDDFGIKAEQDKPKPKAKAPSWEQIEAIYQADPSRLRRLIPDDGEDP